MVDLEECDVCSADIPSLLREIESASDRHLGLANVRFRGESFSEMVEGLKTLDRLDSLELFGPGYPFAPLVELVRTARAPEMHVSGSLFDDEQGREVSRAAKRNPALQEFHFESQNLGSKEGLVGFCDLFRGGSPSLCTVSMRFCNLRARDFLAVMTALRGNDSLKELLLEDNDFGDFDEVGTPDLSICHAAMGLEVLQLDRCKIGNRGMLGLARFLCARGWSRLCVLTLRGNLIGDAGACLAPLFIYGTNLKHIYLNSNSIGVTGARSVRDAAVGGSCAEEIHLYNNRFTERDIPAIVNGSRARKGCSVRLV